MSVVAFVTGASSGLGAGLARRLAAEGWAVALAARREPLLRSVAGEIEKAGGRACVCPCDVADRAQVAAAVEHAEAELGPVDLLVANAGVSERTYVDHFDAEGIERVLRTNLLGAVYAVEAVLPGMLERGRGHLVAMGSLAGYGGLPRTAAYSASKGALHNFFESLRLDLRGRGVDVTVVTPGYVRTAITSRNPYPRPFLLEVDDAVERVYRGIRKRRRLVAFPLPLFLATWWGQLLPARLYDRLAGGVRRDGRA